MFRIAFISLLMATGWVAPAHSAPAACSAENDVLHDDCQLAAAVPEPNGTAGPNDALGATIDAPLSVGDYELKTLDQIVGDPAALLHRPIAVAEGRCFYFGVGDYRCIIPGPKPIAVAAAIVIPPEAELAVEQGCTRPGPACAHRILFVSSSFSTQQVAGRTMIVFHAANIMIAHPASSGPARAGSP